MARKPIEVAMADELPEADRLADFPHPRHTETLFGHDPEWHEFQDAIASQRLHHAWLLTGPMGIGKATFAYHAARMLLEKGGPGELGGAQSARLVAQLAHPRLLVIRRPYDPKTKKLTTTIPVDEVRKLRPFISRTTEVESWRIVIIDHANELNIAAANALLKVLEEPPRQTVFFLVAPQPGALLATIRSRCRTLALKPLHGDDFANATNNALSAREDAVTPSLSRAQCEHLETITGGSVARSLQLTDQGGADMMERVTEFITHLPDVDWTRIRAFADDTTGPGHDVRFQLATDLIFHRLANLTKARATGRGHRDDLALAHRLIGPDMVASWAELWERGVRERADAMSLNLDRKAFILGLFSALSKASTHATVDNHVPTTD